MTEDQALLLMFGFGVVNLVGQIWVLIGTYNRWRSTDHAFFVNEMQIARREKRRIIAWTRDGAPVMDEPGTAAVEK